MSIRSYHRSIVFTKVPLGGKFKYKELFQVFPAQLNGMPYSKLQRHFPNILEFWTTPDEKVNVDTEFEELKDSYGETGAILNKQDKFLALLSVITNNLFFRYNDVDGMWGMPILTDEPGPEANTWSTKWCLPHFNFPGMPAQLRIDKFSEVNIKVVNQVPHPLYYVHHPNIDWRIDEEIIFPATIEMILDEYFALSENVRQTVDSAISHVVNSMELYSQKKTLSLLCSFTAVETMVNLEFQNLPVEKCKECGQQKFSIARKFREFLLKYVATAETNKAKFNAFYSLRSKIVHTGEHVINEKLFNNVPKPTRDKHVLTQIEIMQMGKLAILNWLLLKDN